MRVIYKLDDQADVDDLAAEVEGLIGPQGKVVPLATSSSIAVTDIGSNLFNIYLLLKDVSASPEAISFQSYSLKHIPAADAQRQVEALLGMTQGVKNVSVSAGGDSSSDPRRRIMEFFMGRGGSSKSKSSDPNANIHFAVDRRMNALLAMAPACETEVDRRSGESNRCS